MMTKNHNIRQQKRKVVTKVYTGSTSFSQHLTLTMPVSAPHPAVKILATPMIIGIVDNSVFSLFVLCICPNSFVMDLDCLQ